MSMTLINDIECKYILFLYMLYLLFEYTLRPWIEFPTPQTMPRPLCTSTLSVKLYFSNFPARDPSWSFSIGKTSDPINNIEFTYTI